MKEYLRPSLFAPWGFGSTPPFSPLGPSDLIRHFLQDRSASTAAAMVSPNNADSFASGQQLQYEVEIGDNFSQSSGSSSFSIETITTNVSEKSRTQRQNSLVRSEYWAVHRNRLLLLLVLALVATASSMAVYKIVEKKNQKALQSKVRKFS